MGRTFSSIDDFRNTLNVAVNNAILDRMVDGIKETIQASEKREVYTYMPKWGWALETRRKDAGGIMDKNNMIVHTDFGDPNEKTVEVTIKAEWQWAYPIENYGMNWYALKKGAPDPSEDLVETIENRGMYGTPPRPFMHTAEVAYAEHRAEHELTAGLAEYGFD